MRFTAEWLRDREACVIGNPPVPPDACDQESELHDSILKECARRGWYVIHSRMDRRTTTAEGLPDFVIFVKEFVLILECKAKRRKRSEKQAQAAVWLAKLGYEAHLIRSMSDFWTAYGKECEKATMRIISTWRQSNALPSPAHFVGPFGQKCGQKRPGAIVEEGLQP